ncbi:unnamed protein product, partial [Didymodactylos carnosus]
SLPEPLPLYASRNQFAELIANERLTTGAEIGVQKGIFSEILLRNWTNCAEYHAIDLWAHQKIYSDIANVRDDLQETNYQMARQRLKRFEKVLHYHRNFSNLAVVELKDDSLDFIYIDARHDYVGVREDLKLYWPKLKRNGIFAGHDYLDLSEVKARAPKQDWSVDANGVRRTDNKAVKSAVNEFAKEHSLQVLQTSQEKYPSWYLRKYL